MSILPSSNWVFQIVDIYTSNRWVHFLAYATVVAIPFARWRRKGTVLLSLAIGVLGCAFEFAQAVIPGFSGRPQYALADLFGVGAGILLGFNIRTMLSAAEPQNDQSSEPSKSTMPDAES